MRRAITSSLAALAIAMATASAANTTTLYKWTDAQGVVHYSDQPQPNAQKIQIQSAQTYSAPKPAKVAPANPATSKPADANISYQCQVVAPTPEEAFFDPESVSIAVAVTPALSGGDRLNVTLDGAPIQVSPSGQAQIPAPERGAHTVAASVQTADGNTPCAPATFNVQRASLLSPQSPAHH